MEVLADAQVAFGGLDGGVAEGELDLLERHPALVSELGEGTTQVVGGNLHSDPPAVMDDQPFSGPAHAAAMVVAGQYFLAQAAEAGAGAAAAPVAGHPRKGIPVRRQHPFRTAGTSCRWLSSPRAGGMSELGLRETPTTLSPRATVVAAPMPSEFPTTRIRFAMNYIRRQGRPYYRARTNVDVLAVLDTEPEPVKTVEERVEPDTRDFLS